MSGPSSPDRQPEPVQFCTIECSTFHPALIPALFDILRTHARMCGFEDVGHVNVNLTLELMASQATEHDIGALQDRLERLWLGANAYASERRRH